MPFVKLDTGILNSTLWIERDQRELFITALLMAEPREFQEPIKQIKIGELEFTDFEAPPGWYGFVPAASFGIINRAGVSREAGMEALRRLGEPECESRSKDFGGRRMIRMDGGFVILNYMKYREKDHTAAIRQQRLRDRRKAAQESHRDDVESRRDATLPSRNGDVTSRIAEAEADTEAKKQKQRQAPSALTVPEWIPVDEWTGFLEVRKRLRAPNTDRALNGIIRELENLRARGFSPGKVLDQSTTRGWRGVFEIKETNGKSNGRPSNSEVFASLVEEFEREDQLRAK